MDDTQTYTGTLTINGEAIPVTITHTQTIEEETETHHGEPITIGRADYPIDSVVIGYPRPNICKCYTCNKKTPMTNEEYAAYKQKRYERDYPNAKPLSSINGIMIGLDGTSARNVSTTIDQYGRVISVADN